MKILLYNPDNGVTRNFMPHLWMFLLQALTPPEHEVLLIDGNAKPMTEAELVRFIREEQVGLVGIGVGLLFQRGLGKSTSCQAERRSDGKRQLEDGCRFHARAPLEVGGCDRNGPTLDPPTSTPRSENSFFPMKASRAIPASTCGAG